MNTPDDAIAPPHLTLDQVVAYWAVHKPNAPALEFTTDSGFRTVTWSNLEHAIRKVASLLSLDISPGNNIAVVCNDELHFHVLINALWRCGASVLLINRTWGSQVVTDLLNLTSCTILFSDDESWGIDRQLPLNTRHFPRHEHLALTEQVTHKQHSDIDRTAMYATTSGTSDDPKCVRITHRQIRTAYRICFTQHNFSQVRRSASLFPLNGIGIMGVCFLLPREVGASTRTYPSFSLGNIVGSWTSILDDAVDFVYLVPPLVRLLNTLRVRASGSCKVMAFCAAAPVTQAELRTLEEKYPVTVFNAYGLTELTFAVFFGCREPDGGASGSIGRPAGIEAKLIGDDGSVAEGPATGELFLRGPMLTDGYISNPVATAEYWVNGWLRTGDIAERDDTGRYFIRGRGKDAIIRGGVLYYFHELEHYLRRAPDVIDACAFKGRDLPSGDELCAVVQVSRRVNEAVLSDWIKKHVGGEKVPNVLYISTEALPRNSNGKVLRGVLSQMYKDGSFARTKDK